MASNRSELNLMLDNRVNVSKQTVGLVKISGVYNNMFEVPADGANGSFANQITFNNIVVPSLTNTLVSRNIRIRYQVVITVDQSGAGLLKAIMPTYGLNGNTNTISINTVLRAFPLQSVCDTIGIIINGATATINSRQVISALQRTLPQEWIEKQGTECPCQADNLSAFWHATDLAANGASNQVFSSYYNSNGCNRGSFTCTQVTGAGTNNCQYTFDVSESLLISPFVIYDDEVYLSNINTLSINLNFSKISDMVVQAVSYANAAPDTLAGPANPLNVVIGGTQIPVLELTYIQVNPEIVSIPKLTSYAYESINYFPQSFPWATPTVANIQAGTVPAFGTVSVSGNVIRLSSNPTRIYIFGREAIAYRNPAIADYFLGIGDATGRANLSINWGTRSGQLANASTKTLYRMSKLNGYRGSFSQWLASPLIVLDPVEDLGVDVAGGDILPSESGSINVQVNCMFNNYPQQLALPEICSQTTPATYPNGSPFNPIAAGQPTQYEMMVVVVYSGTCSITPDSAVYNLGELSHSEVEALTRTAPNNGNMASTEMYQPTIKAGGLFSKFKSVLGTVANGLKSDMGQKALGYASDYLNKKASGGLMTGAGVRR